MRPFLTVPSFGLLLVTVGAATAGRPVPVAPAPPTPVAHVPRLARQVQADPIARLQEELDAGTRTFVHDSITGYLPALLRALDIPVSSQGLVFSRTSLQTDRITPWSPRALYFNDDVYVGYVQESDFLEIAAMHPTDGAVFYTLSQHETARPRFEREGRTCLMCHQSRAATGGVPGLILLSSITDRHGYPIMGVQEGGMTDATPIRQRWGGWYVTGTHGAGVTGAGATVLPGHSGNVWSERFRHEIPDKRRFREEIDLSAESARLDLTGKFDPRAYLTAQSDIVALMVFVHQAHVHNLLTTLHEVAASLPDTIDDPLARRSADAIRLSGAVERLLQAMLFADAAPLAGPLRGTTTFAEEFPRVGPRDAAGRSLRDLDLERRLFRYPFSFLVYSPSVDALPPLALRTFYRRLDQILRGGDGDDGLAAYAALDAADRRAIRDILLATKPSFARAVSPIADHQGLNW